MIITVVNNGQYTHGFNMLYDKKIFYYKSEVVASLVGVPS